MFVVVLRSVGNFDTVDKQLFRAYAVLKLTVYMIFIFLKLPKREIFVRLGFPDFYTIKSLRVGDFGVKIKTIFKNT